ncbi:MAG: hypothetical protein HY720_03060 [Planctomycetes bacterium]|nr:hypothetical protein [Planctomycetota bacterium]
MMLNNPVAARVLLGLVLAAPPAAAQLSVEILSLSPSEIVARPGRWLPLFCEVESSGEPFEGRLVALAGGRAFSAPVQVEAGGRATVELVLLWPEGEDRVDLALERTGETGAAWSEERAVRVLARETPIALVLDMDGSLAGVLDGLVWGGERAEVLQAGRHLPLFFTGYDGVDLVILARDPFPDEARAEREERALLDWVRAGGVAAAVLQEEPELAAPGLALFCRRWLGVSFAETRICRTPGALQEFAELAAYPRPPSGPVSYVAVEPGPRARVLLGAGPDPLVLAVPQGAGAIALLAFDPASPPLSGWGGTARIFERLETSASFIRPRHLILAALARETREPGVLPLVPFVLPLALYLILFGPIWYLAARHVPGCSLAPFLALSVAAGSALALLIPRRLEQVEVPVACETVFAGRAAEPWAAAWDEVALFAPGPTEFSIETREPLIPESAPGDVELLPQGDEARLSGIPAGAWTWSSLSGRRVVERPAIRSELALGEGGEVTGWVRVPPGLSIDRAEILVGRARLPIGRLPADEDTPVEGRLEMKSSPPGFDHRPSSRGAPFLGALLVGSVEDDSLDVRLRGRDTPFRRRTLLACEVSISLPPACLELPPGLLACRVSTDGDSPEDPGGEIELAAGKSLLAEFVVPAARSGKVSLRIVFPEKVLPGLRTTASVWDWAGNLYRPLPPDGRLDDARALLEPGTGRVRVRLASRTDSAVSVGWIDVGVSWGPP